MPYSQKQWQDRIKDAQGNIVQEGTPFSAGNMNRMEQGIADAHAQLEEAARQKQILIHGVSVLNGGVDAPVNIEIEGRTLIPMQNTVLDPLKYYVLADKRTKLKWADASITAGVSKFTVKAERPTLIRIANLEGKAAGSTLENPHKAGFYKGPSLFPTPSTGLGSGEFNSTGYPKIDKLDGTIQSNSTSVNGEMAQHPFLFDFISEFERNIGRIPRVDIAGKVQWLKDNVNNLICNWHGSGSSVGGNKATLRMWNGTAWADGGKSHTGSVTGKLIWNTSALATYLQSDGFVHFLAYAEPSDGTTPSTINTDYVELEIELKPDAILHAPRVPLYEVTKEHYDAINVTMLEDEVLRRYPSVEGVTHLQNPYIMAEGENLLTTTADAWEFGSIGTTSGTNTTAQASIRLINSIAVVGGQAIGFSVASPYQIRIYQYDATGNYINALGGTQTGSAILAANARFIRAVSFVSGGTTMTVEEVSAAQPMLNLGTTAKPFTPRNPSYALFETKLGKIGDIADRLYEQDAKYFKRKVVEDVILDGSLAWVHNTSDVGYKIFRLPAILGADFQKTSGIVTKYDGKVMYPLNNSLGGTKADIFRQMTSDINFFVNVSNLDTGFAESYVPTANECQAYFNGWKVKTVDGSSKPTAWVSIVDGTDAPTQTLDYVKSNKAANYTPYKLTFVSTTPKVEEIKSEGAISVNGLTQIEVGSGVIVREKVTPSTTANYAHINNVGVVGATDNPLSKRAAKILNVYANGQKDTQKWTPFSTYANGAQRMHLEIANYDATAIYTVTYLVLDRQPFTANPVNVSAQFANNIRGALEDTTKKVEDVKTETSVNSLILYDVLKRLKAGGL